MSNKGYKILSIILISMASADGRCPHDSLLNPCSCEEDYYNQSIVRCHHISNDDDLQKVFDDSADYPFHTFSLRNSTLNYLKPNWLFEKNIKELELFDSTLISLFDSTPNVTLPFLTEITLTNMVLLRRLRLADLKPFVQLKVLNVYATEVRLGKMFQENVSPELKMLIMVGSKVLPLKDGMFDGKKKMIKMVIQGGGIQILKNSYFKGPKASLMWLDLSDNPIESLPNDLFRGFRNLKAFWLNGARIKTLPKILFEGVLNSGQAHFYGNPLVCDCKMKWITAERSFQVYGSCASPSTLTCKRLELLTEEDFDAC